MENCAVQVCPCPVASCPRSTISFASAGCRSTAAPIIWEVTLILRLSKTSRSRGKPSLKPYSYHLLAGRSGYFGLIFGIGLSAPLLGCAPASICIETETTMRAPSGQKVPAARLCCSEIGPPRVTDDGTAPAIAAIAPTLIKSRREVIVLLPNALSRFHHRGVILRPAFAKLPRRACEVGSKAARFDDCDLYAKRSDLFGQRL